ncbi:hypothetical protein B0J12DRAFT_227544 [Macrophomina phaseolina]|uniref:Uncharacterized protein n=1 Tax=Macrophomina phaseolina TaxID=35725 RepID=A0ABQ8GPM2_9PEZI|nr:hypothetical protein B0J12DRAFT_227544 [Macrophomina phaseolina]
MLIAPTAGQSSSLSRPFGQICAVCWFTLIAEQFGPVRGGEREATSKRTAVACDAPRFSPCLFVLVLARDYEAIGGASGIFGMRGRREFPRRFRFWRLGPSCYSGTRTCALPERPKLAATSNPALITLYICQDLDGEGVGNGLTSALSGRLDH